MSGLAFAPGIPSRLTTWAHDATPRSLLLDVVRACRADEAVAGSPYPCSAVTADAPGMPAHVVMRPPLMRTHTVVVPLRRLSGIEAVIGDDDRGRGYLAEAWDARRYVQDALGTPGQVGIAVNSALTRSQDQLHIHVDCVLPTVSAAVAAQAGAMPYGSWKRDGFALGRHRMWARLMRPGDLARDDPFALAAEIPEVARDPGRATLAVVPTARDGGDAVALLVGMTDPSLDRGQFTGEHLLDHSCARPAR